MGLPNTAIVVHAVGQALVHRGQLDAALAHYRGAIAGLPSNHPYVPSVMTAIGQILGAQGEHEQAIVHLRAGLRGKREAISQNHPFTAFTLVDLGDALRAAERVDEALDAYRRALPVLERRLGALNTRTLACHLAIARLLVNAGGSAEAKPHVDQVLASELYGLGNAAQIAAAYATLGQIEYQQGLLDPAIGSFQRALDELSDRDDSDPEIQALLLDLGRVHHRKGESELAIALFRRGLEAQRRSQGSEHPNIAMILNAIGQVLYAQGDYQGALNHYHQALEIRQRLLGDRHPQTITTRFNCGTAMRQLGDPFGTEEMEAAVESLEELLGVDHPQAKATRAWLR